MKFGVTECKPSNENLGTEDNSSNEYWGTDGTESRAMNVSKGLNKL